MYTIVFAVSLKPIDGTCRFLPEVFDRKNQVFQLRAFKKVEGTSVFSRHPNAPNAFSHRHPKDQAFDAGYYLAPAVAMSEASDELNRMGSERCQGLLEEKKCVQMIQIAYIIYIDSLACSGQDVWVEELLSWTCHLLSHAFWFPGSS